MPQRFYQVELDNRPAFWEDIGERLIISGVVLEGAERTIVLHTPNSNANLDGLQELRLTREEWSKFIQCSDDPHVFELDETGGIKAVHRKLRYVISGEIQQSIWARDKFRCMFCHAEMGERLLTIDHFFPLETGGRNDPTNYLTACRKCNTKKGNKDPKTWCDERGLNYQHYVDYLKRVNGA